MQSTSVRIDIDTHRHLKTIAQTLDVSVGEAVRLAVRGLRQELMGAELTEALSADEAAWLDADLG
ncbi:MAG: hypothetical protein ACYC90_05965 [Candidatus Nanopelagicales bacterium]